MVAGFNRRSLTLSLVGWMLGVKAFADDDLANAFANSVSKKPFIVFAARSAADSNANRGPDDAKSYFGHAMIASGVELDNGLLFYKAVYGYYPSGNSLQDVKAIALSVPGVLEQHFVDLTWSVKCRANISDDQSAAVDDLLLKWSSSDPGYQLFANGGMNCNAFAGEVAKAIGLSVPPNPGSTLPENYIKRLKEMNNL